MLATLVALFGARIGAWFSLRGRLTAGLARSGAGLAALAFVQPSWTFPQQLPGFVLAGLGVGLANPVLGAIIHGAALGSARSRLPVAADLLATGDLRGAEALTSPAAVQAAYAVAQTTGVRLALVVSAVLALLGALGAAFLLRPRPEGRTAPVSARAMTS